MTQLVREDDLFVLLQALTDRIANLEASNKYPIGTIIMSVALNADEGYILCDGREISRETYSILFSTIGTLFGDGDGSTTFNVPNLEGRAPIGAGTLKGDATAGSGEITAADSNFKYSVGQFGGEAEHTLTSTESGQPASAATGLTATTSGSDGAHTHAATGLTATTSGSDGTHTHSSTSDPGNHTHGPGASTNYLMSSGAQQVSIGSGLAGQDATPATTGGGGAHTHSVNSAGSGHGHTITMGGTISSSGTHGHIITMGGALTAAAAAAAHNNLQPYVALNFYIVAE